MSQTYQRLFYPSNPRKALQWRAQQNEENEEDAIKKFLYTIYSFFLIFFTISLTKNLIPKTLNYIVHSYHKHEYIVAMKYLKIAFSDLLWPMYVKIDGELKSIKRIELKSNATTILIHTITDEGLEEEYKCFSDSPNYYHLRCLLSADIYIISDIICGNKEQIF